MSDAGVTESVNDWVVAALQMISSDVLQQNLVQLEGLLAEAVTQGAQLVVLPENFALMPKQSSQLLPLAEDLGAGPVQDFLARLAKKHGCWIVAGSLPIRSACADKVYATCLVYDDSGQQRAHYYKIHLFDVEVADQTGRYCESDTFAPGEKTVVLDTPFGRLGLSICYDLRFPELYRQLLQQGAELIVAPSAFTEVTGRAHWSLLCRTRALENSCYLIAANQGGLHINGRSTYGHSMIVDPWGEVLAELNSGSGIAVVRLTKTQLNKVRTSFPVIKHRRLAITREQ